MIDNDSERNPVEELAEEFLQRRRNGEQPTLSEYVDKYPQWEDDIKDVFSAVLMIEHVNPVSDDFKTEPPSSGLTSGGEKLKRLGEYRIIAELGRGGMGVVYEAEHVSLRRRVALKVLPEHAMIDQKYLRRFELKARAAAQLHHTNIVPVFEVGHQEQLHFFVMQFIRGMGLDKVLKDLRDLRKNKSSPATPLSGDSSPEGSSPGSARVIAESILSDQFRHLSRSEADSPEVKNQGSNGSSADSGDASRTAASSDIILTPDSNGYSSSHSSGHYWRNIARIGAQVADALGYAHAHGILHRDIKPSNLLLDVSGTAWVADFGLAKLDEESELTGTGDIVGTIRYMAPERFKGESDARSDIYGLGLTLYELASLQPAYDDSNRHRLVESVVQHTPIRPRKIDSRIPRDLETIILKAIARDSASRYQTAGELKGDLERFIEDRPIKARRTSNAERLWRWSRRNPAVAGLTVVVLALLIVIAGISFAFRQRSPDNLAGENRVSPMTSQADSRAMIGFYDARVAEAQASMTSRQVGQRLEALSLLEQAAPLIDKLKYDQTQRLRLRNLTIQALRLVNVQDSSTAHGTPRVGAASIMDQSVTHRAYGVSKSGELVVQDVVNDLTVAKMTTGQPWRSIKFMEFSRDRRYLAAIWRSGADARRYYLSVWEIGKDPQPLKTMPIRIWREWANPFCFHPDKPAIAVSTRSHNVQVVDLETSQARTIAVGKYLVSALQFSPDGKRLAIARHFGVEIWDSEKSKLIWSRDDVGEILQLNWSDDGHRLTSISRDRAFIYYLSAKVGEKGNIHVRQLNGSGGRNIAFHPNGNIVLTSGWSNTCQFWDPNTGRRILEIPDARTHFSRDGTRVATTSGSSRFLFDCEDHYVLNPPTGTRRNNQLLDVHSNGRMLLVGVWGMDLARRNPISGAGPWLKRFSSANELLTFKNTGIVRSRIERREHEDEIVYTVHPGTTLKKTSSGLSALSNNGLLINATYYRQPIQVTLTDLSHGTTRRLKPHHRNAKFVDITRDGRFVATGTWHGSYVKIWDAGTLKVIKEIKTGSARPKFSPDGRLLVVNEGKKYSVFTTADWQTVFKTEGSGGAHPRPAAFSPDGSLLAICRPERSVQILNAQSFEEIATFRIDEDVGALAFDLTGSRFIISTEVGAIHVWNLHELRKRLASMRLDWNTPPIPKPPGRESKPMRFVFNEPASRRTRTQSHAWIGAYLRQGSDWLGERLHSLPDRFMPPASAAETEERRTSENTEQRDR